MSSLKTVAFGLAVVFISAVSAQAATPKHMTHKPMHSTSHRSSTGTPSADHSADSLNAQSLTRAQAPQ